MTSRNCKFWPYPPRMSVLLGIFILVGLLMLVAVLRKMGGWPSAASETTLLIGILASALLPIVLALIDLFIERGGSIEYGDIKVDFSQVSQIGNTGFPSQSVMIVT